MRSLILGIVVATAAAACSADPAVVSFEELDSKGMAFFSVENRSGIDIAHLTFELTYLSADGEVVVVDTLHYQSGVGDGEGETRPFLEADDETFIVRAAPEGSASATASILELTYTDSTTWPGGD